MASPVSINADKHRATLHGVILTAVHNDHDKAITRALEVLREHNLEKRNPKGSRSGKQVLDFLPPPNSAHVSDVFAIEFGFYSISDLMAIVVLVTYCRYLRFRFN